MPTSTSIFFFSRFAADSGRYAEFSRAGAQNMLVATDGKIAKVRAFFLSFVF